MLTDYRVRQNKVAPWSFFAVFSATIWNFNLKFYRFIFWNFLHLTAKWNMILLKNDEVIDFLTWPPTDFWALKCSSYNTNSITRQLARSQFCDRKRIFFTDRKISILIRLSVTKTIEFGRVERKPTSSSRLLVERKKFVKHVKVSAGVFRWQRMAALCRRDS